MSEPLTSQQQQQELSAHLSTVPHSIYDMIFSYYGDMLLDRLFTLPTDTVQTVLEFSGIFCVRCGALTTRHCDARWFLETDDDAHEDVNEPKCIGFVCTECDYDIFDYEIFYTCDEHRIYDEETGQDLSKYLDVNYFSSDTELVNE